MRYFKTPLLLIAVISLFFLSIQWKTIWQQPERSTDYYIYYNSAATFANDPSHLYTSSSAGFDQYIYPPPSILLFRFFHLFPEKTSYFIFTTIMVGCLIASVLLCLSQIRRSQPATGPRRPQTLSYLLFALASAPAYHNMSLGQINCLVLLLSMCYLYFQQKRPLLAGILLAAAIWLKLYPILLLLPALFSTGPKKAIHFCVIGSLLIPVATLPWIAPHLYLDFFRKMTDLSQYTSIHIINQSLIAFGRRLSFPAALWFQWPNIYTIPFWLKVLNYGLLILLFVEVAARSGWKKDPLLLGSVMLAAGAVFSPLGWGHTYVYTLPIVIIGMHEITRRFTGSVWPWIILLPGALLFLIPVYNHPATLDRLPALLQDIYYSRFLCLTLLLIFFALFKLSAR